MPMLSLNPLTAFVKEHEENEDVLNPKRPLGRPSIASSTTVRPRSPTNPGSNFIWTYMTGRSPKSMSA